MVASVPGCRTQSRSPRHEEVHCKRKPRGEMGATAAVLNVTRRSARMGQLVQRECRGGRAGRGEVRESVEGAHLLPAGWSTPVQHHIGWLQVHVQHVAVAGRQQTTPHVMQDLEEEGQGARHAHLWHTRDTSQRVPGVHEGASAGPTMRCNTPLCTAQRTTAEAGTG